MVQRPEINVRQGFLFSILNVLDACGLTYNFRYESVDLDEATSQLAIHYLFLAAERGDHQAIFEIKEYKLKNSAPYALQIKKMFERNR